MTVIDFLVFLRFRMFEKICVMRHFFPKLVSLVLFWSILIISCKKDDPAPLGAQTNAIYLAGQKGKSKDWKLREFTFQSGSNPAQTQTLVGCFADNIYTFTNNNAQDYAATEGTSQCYNSNAIESGTWAFTLDGLLLNVEIDNTQTPNGLFSPEIYVEADTTGKITSIYNGGYTPYPAFVKKLDANNLILEVNATRGSKVYKYTLTFTPA